jgi:hypothetical protein
MAYWDVLCYVENKEGLCLLHSPAGIACLAVKRRKCSKIVVIKEK